MTNSKRVWAGTIVIALVSVIVSVSGGVASASTAHGHRSRGHHGHHQHHRSYVALGDSITFGYSPLLEDPWIPARFVGYPELIGDQTGLDTTNLACPGQTAQALISRTAFDNGCFDARDGYKDAGLPFLHTDYDGTQLEAALDAVRSDSPPSLITIQGGGNEFGSCVFDNPDPESDPQPCLDEAFPKVTASLREAATQLRAAGYRGRIVLVGYQLLPGLEPLMRPLNRAVERAARGSHIAFANVAEPFDQYARRHHGDICTTGLLVRFPDGSCDLHPTLTGQHLIADAVLRAAHEHGHGHHHHGHGAGKHHRH